MTFECGKSVSLPAQYNKILQAAILNWLGDGAYASFLHDEGYKREKRKFKLYTFSNIFGTYEYDISKRKIIFLDKIQLYLSFYTEASHEMILRNIEERKPLCLGNHLLKLYDCELVQETYTDCLVETVSPVTIHSTFELVDGRKKTYYYNPFEKDFSEMIRQNLIRKYEAFYGEAAEENKFRIVPEKGQQLKSVTTYYNRFLIRSWNGKFRLFGSEEMIRMALLSGIGARNGIGFGCLLQKKIL